MDSTFEVTRIAVLNKEIWWTYDGHWGSLKPVLLFQLKSEAGFLGKYERDLHPPRLHVFPCHELRQPASRVFRNTCALQTASALSCGVLCRKLKSTYNPIRNDYCDGASPRYSIFQRTLSQSHKDKGAIAGPLITPRSRKPYIPGASPADLRHAVKLLYPAMTILSLESIATALAIQARAIFVMPSIPKLASKLPLSR